MSSRKVKTDVRNFYQLMGTQSLHISFYTWTIQILSTLFYYLHVCIVSLLGSRPWSPVVRLGGVALGGLWDTMPFTMYIRLSHVAPYLPIYYYFPLGE